MSAEINNREYRQKVLKELITQLHDGKSVDEVKDQFAEVFGNVSAEEIAQAEQALIQNGLPVSEIQRLCDVHAAVFKGSIEEIHQPSDPAKIPGHPVNLLWRENRALEKLMKEMRTKLAFGNTPSDLKELLTKLMEIDLHYSKKENLLFPYLEQYGITAPPKVMWGVDDEIRDELKDIRKQLDTASAEQLKPRLEALFNRVEEMIFKEENILFPMLTENLTQDEWKVIAGEVPEIGLCLIDNVPIWKPAAESKPQEELKKEAGPGVITLPTGVLKTEELVRMLDTLPIDITFVDKDDTVKYFSQGSERVFPRTKSIIGRKVSNCHPPASVHIVEQLVKDFRDGRKDQEDFWIKMGEKYILIRYFAVRSETGEFMGVLEVTQNIRPIQEITGEKRLVEDTANH
ncbi:MAG: DUF438 domain-containing protein [Clostridium sp.]|uniref:DUF438 domain-containing protein n=1 Tax=Clostridium sp. TaxID=1506 RepID=UPI00290E4F4D|nr:DUF438 domain-containing protein [Clostridium sp.]MDU7338068.1 DUF438 domain-containing protein [Clostridium sp.]